MFNQSLGCPNFPSWAIAIPRRESLVFVNDLVIVTVNTPLCLCAFIANLSIIIAVIKTSALRFRSYVLLSSLAAADCLTGLIAQPLFICSRMGLHYANCRSLKALFVVAKVSFFAINGCSYVMLIPISCDRLYALAWPLHYRAVAKEMKGTMLVSVAAWVYTSAFSALVFILPDFLYAVAIPSASLMIGIPIVCHIVMFIALRRHNRNISVMNNMSAQVLAASLRVEKKVACTMALIILILLILLLPSVVVFSMGASPLTVSVIFPWTTTLNMMTSSLNPVLHLWRDETLRGAVKSLFPVQFANSGNVAQVPAQ